MADEPSLIQYGRFIVEGILAISTITLGVLSYTQNNKVKGLEEEKEYLKKEIHKVSSKVDPESDRKLLVQANQSVQIMGINSLGPLHHCREEIIEFLTDRNGTLYIILLDPLSEAFVQRQRREGEPSTSALDSWACLTIALSCHSASRIPGEALFCSCGRLGPLWRLHQYRQLPDRI